MTNTVEKSAHTFFAAYDISQMCSIHGFDPKLSKKTKNIEKLIAVHGSEYTLIRRFLEDKYPMEDFIVIVNEFDLECGRFSIKVFDKCLPKSTNLFDLFEKIKEGN